MSIILSTVVYHQVVTRCCTTKHSDTVGGVAKESDAEAGTYMSQKSAAGPSYPDISSLQGGQEMVEARRELIRNTSQGRVGAM